MKKFIIGHTFELDKVDVEKIEVSAEEIEDEGFESVQECLDYHVDESISNFEQHCLTAMSLTEGEAVDMIKRLLEYLPFEAVSEIHTEAESFLKSAL